jgi:hypothetical protein
MASRNGVGQLVVVDTYFLDVVLFGIAGLD